jgi:hypothetical protein
MLQERKPDIEWYSPGGLEDMFFCLYQCDREGPDPEDNVREHREPLVRQLLSDERLIGCLGYVHPKDLEELSYAQLRRHAIFLKEQVLRWMDGRVYDRREQRKARKGVKRHVKVRRREKPPPRSLCGIGRDELARMLMKLETFLEYGEDPQDLRQQTLAILCHDADAIVSDDRFRSFSWHATPYTLPYVRLYEAVDQAQRAISFMLKILELQEEDEDE